MPNQDIQILSTLKVKLIKLQNVRDRIDALMISAIGDGIDFADLANELHQAGERIRDLMRPPDPADDMVDL